MNTALVRTETARRVSQAMVLGSMSKTALAKLSGIPYASLDRRLRALQPFSLDDLLMIASVLEVDPKSLLCPPFSQERAA